MIKLCDHTYLICFILCCKPKTNVPCNINSNLQQKKGTVLILLNCLMQKTVKSLASYIPEQRRNWLTLAVNNKSGLIKTSSWQTKLQTLQPFFSFWIHKWKNVQCLESQKAVRTAMSALQRYQFYSFTLLLTVSSESQASWGQVGISSILSSL